MLRVWEPRSKPAIIGRTMTIEELFDNGFTVFIGSGAGLPMFMRIPVRT